MRLKSVVLPAPFGPMIPTISPAPTANDTSVSARKPPNRLLTERTSRSGGIGPSRLPVAGSQADQAARKIDHDDHQQDRVEHLAGGGHLPGVLERQVAEHLADAAEEHRSQHGPEGGAGATDHRPEHHVELRLEDEHGGWSHIEVELGVEGPRQ